MTTQSNERIPQFTRGDRLRKARSLTGLNTRDFAHEIGVSHGTITNAEKDKPVRPITLKQWAVRTGVPVEWLEHGIDPRTGGDDGGGNIAPSTASSSLSSGPPTSSYPVLVAAA